MTESIQPDNKAGETGQPRTLWHRLLGKELELALTPVGITVLTEVQVSSNPPKADILLLRRYGNAWTTEQLPFLPDGVRSSQASHILIEFKYRETLQEETLQQAVGYDYFYLQGQQLARSQVETFVCSAKTPQPSTLQAFGYEQAETAGVYRSKFMLVRHVTLLILNELAPVAYNAFIQCFASQRRVRRAAFQQLLPDGRETLNEALWDFLTGLQHQMQTKDRAMSEAIYDQEEDVLTPEMVMETGRLLRKSLIANLTLEERKALIYSLPLEEKQTAFANLPLEERKVLFANLPAEERKILLVGLPVEERKIFLDSLPVEERLAGLAPEERLAGLAPEEMVALMEQIEAYLRTQNKDPK